MESGSKSPEDPARRAAGGERPSAARASTVGTLPEAPTLAEQRPARVEVAASDGATVVSLSGAWRLSSDRPGSDAIVRELVSKGVQRAGFDSSELGTWDSALLSFLRELDRGCREAGIEIDRSGLPEGASRLLELAEAVPERKAEASAPPLGHLERLGRFTFRFLAQWLEFFTFLGQVVLATGRVITLKARFRRSDLLLYLQQTGADALPIITLISLLVGLILAFVGALQLKQFGADIFVADLVGIGMLREMGSMMTGIIMAGRTGAAFAAQLGSMKVAEEIDALVTFGISPIEFLVVPRILALCLMMPLLCLYSNALGILGGAVVGSGVLDISTELYWRETLHALTFTDLAVGVAKACVYGLLVAVSGCLRGMQARGGAEAVGAAATSAVVTAIVAIVVADGLFAVVCNALGL
jgi:phospholipid/cholesterol/gamma-HCH transport system permease protein